MNYNRDRWKPEEGKRRTPNVQHATPNVQRSTPNGRSIDREQRPLVPLKPVDGLLKRLANAKHILRQRPREIVQLNPSALKARFISVGCQSVDSRLQRWCMFRSKS